MIHFDIEPSNILIGDMNCGDSPDRLGDFDGHVFAPVFKIADFGSARRHMVAFRQSI
ncbi:hypothetical protein QBC34DRAFT_380088 [Podospora aff. communis PSN243]|uniref:Protein kinase domain-containing protein n=1 Tax=Podospora aff. communis PSN243 TaxID=3040156 RepID=A0AAV9GSL2_9PEZI|nr:hypothetical protein QBC34DRAFT_380088 [Podospora aff. communis PSN243]